MRRSSKFAATAFAAACYFRPTFVVGVAGPVHRHSLALRPGKGQLIRRIGRERTYCTCLRLTRQQARRDLHEEEIMPHTRYIVVQHKDEWLIKFGDEEYGPYHSRAEAMLFAIDAAQKLKGFPAEVNRGFPRADRGRILCALIRREVGHARNVSQ
jgi:hypothetical protein